MARGVAYCSDDRKRDGIFAGRRVTENLSATALSRVTRAGLISPKMEGDLALSIARHFEIDPGRIQRSAGALSGGNQQKVALGKWLAIRPRILLVEEPTRGVDVGARAEIYRRLRDLANEGLAIVFASSDTQEVHGLADRVATFYHGELVRIADAEAMSVEDIARDVTHPTMARQAS
jgi:ribose transport system ATP-binding protein/rhamnose transport system ATP-binding protein